MEEKNEAIEYSELPNEELPKTDSASTEPKQPAELESRFHALYDDTFSFLHEVADKYDFYPNVLSAMREGFTTIELRKRFMLRAIDETWVRVVEDSLTALDELIRKPSRYIEESDEILPIELSRHITSRSIQHLSQHTDYISEVNEKEETVTPTKILNVFHEETMLTYENRFINTLIYRLFLFVNRRYTVALEAGKDEKNTSLDFNQEFEHGEVTAKVQFHIEVSEEPQEGERVKNYIYTTDIWRRVERLYEICRTYMSSAFVKQMNKAYIRPPVMRTNAILKNRNLRQCLALWQFIESYENTGIDTLIHEDLETLDPHYVEELYANSALQYSVFRNQIRNEFEPDKMLAEYSAEQPFEPTICEELVPTPASKYDVSFTREIPIIEEGKDDNEKLDSYEWNLLEAIEVALEAEGFDPNPFENSRPEEIDEESEGFGIDQKEVDIPGYRLTQEQWKRLLLQNFLSAGMFASLAATAAMVAVGGVGSGDGKDLLLAAVKTNALPKTVVPSGTELFALQSDSVANALFRFQDTGKSLLESLVLFGIAAFKTGWDRSVASQKPNEKKQPKPDLVVKTVNTVFNAVEKNRKAGPTLFEKNKKATEKPPFEPLPPLVNPDEPIKKGISDAAKSGAKVCGKAISKAASGVLSAATFGAFFVGACTKPKHEKQKS